MKMVEERTDGERENTINDPLSRWMHRQQTELKRGCETDRDSGRGEERERKRENERERARERERERCDVPLFWWREKYSRTRRSKDRDSHRTLAEKMMNRIDQVRSSQVKSIVLRLLTDGLMDGC